MAEFIEKPEITIKEEIKEEFDDANDSQFSSVIKFTNESSLISVKKKSSNELTFNQTISLKETSPNPDNFLIKTAIKTESVDYSSDIICDNSELGDPEELENIKCEPDVYNSNICEEDLVEPLEFEFDPDTLMPTFEPCDSNQPNKSNVTHLASNRKIWQCSLCQECFPDIKSYSQHSYQIHGEFIYRCNICSVPNDSSQKKEKDQHQLPGHRLTSSSSFKCPQCHLLFHFESDLRDHILQTHYYFKCRKCPELFCTVSKLKLHYKQSNHESIFNCKICPKFFVSTRELNVHRKFHLSSNSKLDLQQCHLCEQLFDNQSELQNHKILQHQQDKVEDLPEQNFPGNFEVKVEPNDEIYDESKLEDSESIENGKIYECSICPEKFPESQSYAKHSYQVHGKLVLRCDFCDSLHTNQSELKTDESSSGFKHECPTCSKQFKFKIHLTNHIQSSHSETSTGSKKCPDCTKTFCSDTKLNFHYQQAHGKNKSYQCKLCSNSFKSLKGLKAHHEWHFEKNPKLRVKAKINAENLKNTEKKPQIYKCNQCVRSFIYQSQLKRHQEENHTVYKCPHCLKLFFTKYILKMHENTCYNESSHICKECGKRFLNSEVLKQHLDNANCSFKCTQCMKSFKSKNLLIFHQRIHTDNKLFPCSKNCGQTFRSQTEAKDHVQNCKGIKVSSCVICNLVYETKAQLNHHMASYHGRKRRNYQRKSLQVQNLEAKG